MITTNDSDNARAHRTPTSTATAAVVAATAATASKRLTGPNGFAGRGRDGGGDNWNFVGCPKTFLPPDDLFSSDDRRDARATAAEQGHRHDIYKKTWQNDVDTNDNIIDMKSLYT